jgi:putative zinc finger/helix-turn-helix YgiT family protein
MRCTKCGHEMAMRDLTMKADVRGESFDVRMEASQCGQCGRVSLSGKSRKMYNRLATDAYRAHHGLLTTRELDALRRNLGMPWTTFAEFVGVGIATLKRWISGEIQSPSLDQLVRLKADLEFVEKSRNELLVRLSMSYPVQLPFDREAATAVNEDYAMAA